MFVACVLDRLASAGMTTKRMVKEVHANGTVSRRLVLPGKIGMMGKVKKIGKKETMRSLMTMEEARIVGEPSA